MSSVFRFCVLAWTLGGILPAFAAGWAVPDATVCAKVEMTRRPDQPELGIFVKLPDGGLLPGPCPVASVFDSAGKELACRTIGANPKDGLSLVFEAPLSGTHASIYIRGAQSFPAPSPAAARLFPSTIIAVRNNVPARSVDAAKAMNKNPVLPSDAIVERWYWTATAVNPLGPDDYYVLWISGAFKLDKPENIFFATVSDEGSEGLVDGKSVVRWDGIHTRDGGIHGEHGKMVKLDAGLHRLDYYQFEATGFQEANFLWRRSSAEPNALPGDICQALEQSGTCVVRSITTKDGRAGADIRQHASTRQNDILARVPQAKSYFWMGKAPLILFDLEAVGLPEGATAYWEHGKGKRFKGPKFPLLISGQPDTVAYPVTLVVENAKGKTRTTRILRCPVTPIKATVNDAFDCADYLRAFTAKVLSVAEPADPCADWSADEWQLLGELLEPYSSAKMMVPIFTNARASLKKCSKELRAKMQDRLLEQLRVLRKFDSLIKWYDTFISEETDGARRFELSAMKLESLVFDLVQLDVAEVAARRLREIATAPDQVRLAALRSGDVAYAQGKGDDAVRFYQDAEDRWRANHRTGAAGGSRLSSLATSRSAKEKTASVRAFTLPAASKTEEWKTYTVRNSSMFATAMSLLRQGALGEALAHLRDWENETPTAKLDGEYPIAFAKVYMQAKDYRRAASQLDCYVRGTGFSAQLADAMLLEAECLEKLGDKARLKEIGTEFLRKFPGHPFEPEMKRWAR